MVQRLVARYKSVYMCKGIMNNSEVDSATMTYMAEIARAFMQLKSGRKWKIDITRMLELSELLRASGNLVGAKIAAEVAASAIMD